MAPRVLPKDSPRIVPDGSSTSVRGQSTKNTNGPPPSAFAEPSEPSDRAPEENGKEQLTNPQEENPQLIAHKPGKQAVDGPKRYRSK
ncbi:hypothetical protein FRB90_008612, partial [Tulasnella sp. 427]